MKYCEECGTQLTERELEHEGIVPFCPTCREFRFPKFNIAVSMIVLNEQNQKTLFIKQYGKDFYRLVAGYVNRTEQLEHAAIRELAEETGMTAARVQFNRTEFFAPSNTLMCNFTAFVEDDAQLHPNYEVDAYAWFSLEEAEKAIRPDILAGRFFNTWLADWRKGV